MVVLITGASHTGKTALAQKIARKIRISILIYRPFKNGTDPQRIHKAYT